MASLQDPTQALPFEVSCIIFSFVPVEDLVKKCVLVCKYWKQISDDYTTWRLKCERSKRYVKKCMGNYEPNDWKEYYFKNPYSRNLIKNPNLSDAFSNINMSKIIHLLSSPIFSELSEEKWRTQFAPWEMQSIGGSGIQLEFPPIGCPPVPNGDAGCLATSFGAMKRCQVIDLLAEGVNEYILDEVKIPIYVCEWFNSRYDCGVKYFMKVALMDCKRNKIPGFKISYNGEKGDDQNEWDKFEYTFRDYPSGVRYIQFKDYGQDTKYWEGFYGAKLAGATVRFLLESM